MDLRCTLIPKYMYIYNPSERASHCTILALAMNHCGAPWAPPCLSFHPNNGFGEFIKLNTSSNLVCLLIDSLFQSYLQSNLIIMESPLEVRINCITGHLGCCSLSISRRYSLVTAHLIFTLTFEQQLSLQIAWKPKDRLHSDLSSWHAFDPEINHESHFARPCLLSSHIYILHNTNGKTGHR